ncbi:MAG TPA: hypothetical protein PLZ44_01855 [Methanothrix sp.]|nr:hypothetical protein [Methanothrix sp.]
MTEIEKIAGPLRELLKSREIIARCELLLRTYQIVRAAKPSDEERRELAKQVGEKIAPGIFASIMGKDPVFFDLPKLDTYTQMDGRIFHFLHTKRYSKQDFANAQSKYLRSLPELKAILLQCMIDRAIEFMNEAGYSLSKESGQSLTFSAKDGIARVSVVSSVRALDIKDFQVEPGVDCIIIVPSSESLEPFVQFFRENGQAAEDKGLQIWIMNLEKGTIDPFIGYTTDLDIYNQFDNPRLAEMVRNNWSQSSNL